MIIRHEGLPKAVYRRNAEEIDYFRFAFSKISKWVTVDDTLIEDAIRLGERYDVVNLDALYLAAAIRGGAERFVTTERPGKPLYRVREIKVVSFLDPSLNVSAA